MTVEPPELPRARFFTIGTFIAIFIILIDVALVLHSLYGPKPETEFAQIVEEPATDTVFEMQSKVTVGLGSVSHPFAIKQLDDLIPLATTPAGARAVSVLMVYLDREQFREQALELLADSFADRPVDDLIRLAITDPDRLTEADQQLLADELDWTGRVLLATIDPSKKADLEAEGVRLFTIFTCAILFGFLAAAVGTGLLLLGLLIKPKNRPRRFRFQPDCPERGRVYFQGFACYLAGMVGIGLIFGLVIRAEPSPIWNILPIGGALILGLVWPLLRHVPFATMKRELGLHTGAGFFKEIGAGIVGYIAITPIIGVGLGLTVLMNLIVTAVSDGTAEPMTHPVFDWFAEPSWQIFALVFFFGSVLAPVTEEIMFRGALYRGLRFRFGMGISIVVMSFLFAIVHPQGIVAVPGLMMIAVGLTLLREWRDSIIAPIIAHGIHNGILLALATAAFAG